MDQTPWQGQVIRRLARALSRTFPWSPVSFPWCSLSGIVGLAEDSAKSYVSVASLRSPATGYVALHVNDWYAFSCRYKVVF